MSLIDEALKRARQEAAQQDAARRGAGEPWVPMPLAPLRERRSAPLLAAAAVALLLLGGGIVWLLGRRPAPAPPARVAASAPSPASPVAEPPRPAHAAELPRATQASRALDGSRRADRSEPAPRTGRSEPERSDRIADRAPEASRARRAEPPPDREAPVGEAPAVREAARPKATERPASRTASSALEDGRSYVREAPLGNGRKLELRGIAFSDTQPVVLVNGKVLSPGESVEGYTVVSIQPQRVELKGAGGTVYLTLQ